MSQTVKHAKRRAGQDRIDGGEGQDRVGFHYGTNLPYGSLRTLSDDEWARAMHGQKTTRGACG